MNKLKLQKKKQTVTANLLPRVVRLVQEVRGVLALIGKEAEGGDEVEGEQEEEEGGEVQEEVTAVAEEVMPLERREKVRANQSLALSG